jgi:excinuclease UvrABC nuclease subunit
MEYIDQVSQILKGNYQKAKSFFITQMQEASSLLSFEKAQEWK